MTKYLIHTCRRCRNVFIWFKVGEYKRICCPHCNVSMTQGEQEASLKAMEGRETCDEKC